MSQIIGHISQIIGPVIDVYFDTQGATKNLRGAKVETC